MKRVMNTQNQRQKTGRRGGILENKLVTACTVSSSRVLICSNLRGFVFCFNKRGYSRPAASTGPAGKTALPAKRRSQALCSPTLPLGTDTDIQLPRLADRPLRPSGPFGSGSMLIMQTSDWHFTSHRNFATEEGNILTT